MRPSTLRSLAPLSALLSFAALTGAGARAAGASIQILGGATVEVRDDGWYLDGRHLDPSPDLVVGVLRQGSGQSLVAAVSGHAEGSALRLLTVDANGSRDLPSPAGREQTIQRDPAWVATGAEGSALLLWIEGATPRATRVRAARWQEERWTEARTISPVGPGSQIALTAVDLGKGRALAVWTAYDGKDDEIVFAVSSAGGWSKPRPIGKGNRSPDILPALIADGQGGAFAAWSRYDGNDYRVVTARFRQGVWTEPDWAGPPGSVEPTLTRASSAAPDGTPDGPIVLAYRRVVPASWEVLRLDGRGRPAERPLAVAESAAPADGVARGDEALLVEGFSAGRYRLRWSSNGKRFEIERPALP